jgi:hypothetical protein
MLATRDNVESVRQQMGLASKSALDRSCLGCFPLRRARKTDGFAQRVAAIE